MFFSSSTRRSRGFTLVELLVVIGIISILVAVSFPAFRGAMSQARKAKCSSNLRQIGIAFFAFAADNNNSLPQSGGTIPYGSIDPSTPSSGQYGWTQQLEPYVGVNSGKGGANTIYQCPDHAAVTGNDTYSYFNGGHAAYYQAGNKFAALNLIQAKYLSQLVLAGDIAFNGGFSATDCDKDDYQQDPAFNGNSGKIPIHGGYSNILFGDGHVQACSSFDKTQMTTFYNAMNVDYLGTPP